MVLASTQEIVSCRILTILKTLGICNYQARYEKLEKVTELLTWYNLPYLPNLSKILII